MEMQARSLQRIVTVDITERELFLIKWSLELMVRNGAGETMRNDIETLRNKLSMKSVRPNIGNN